MDSIHDYSFLNQGDSSAGGLASMARDGFNPQGQSLAAIGMGQVGSPLGVMHSADAISHHNGGHNPAAGKCAKYWTIDTAIRHPHYKLCPHRYKPKLTGTRKNHAIRAHTEGLWIDLRLDVRKRGRCHRGVESVRVSVSVSVGVLRV